MKEDEEDVGLAFDCIIVMPHPIIVLVVAEGGVDPSLGRHSMRSSREEFGDAGGLEPVHN